jgi:two-component system, cell cycle response regulator DivK
LVELSIRLGTGTALPYDGEPPVVSQRRWSPKSELPPRTLSRVQQRPHVALLVDDTVDSRDMYGEILRFGGYSVLEATDGADALAIALREQPNVIIMDLCMPRMDGWEAIRRLGSDPRTAAIPVIVLTALNRNLGAVQVDCAAYVVKPCLPFELLDVLDTVLAEALHG